MKKNRTLSDYFKENNSNVTEVRFETSKGQQAQLNWKESVRIILVTGEVIEINILVVLLSYSRFRYYGLSLTKTQDVLFNHLDNAFSNFGGVPSEIITDNMKTVMDEPRTEHSKGKVNNKFQTFADDYGFKVLPCIAGRPKTKAKGLNVITSGNIVNKENVLSLGASKFIDYKTEDYSSILKDVDYVLDTLGGEESIKQMSILKKGGHLVALKSVPTGVFAKRMNLPEEIIGISTHIGSEIDEYAKSLGVTYDFLFVTSSGTQLQEGTKIITNHNIKLTVDTVYQFDEVSKALDKVDKKLSRGKTVLVISE